MTCIEMIERCWDQEHAAREEDQHDVADCFASVSRGLYMTFAQTEHGRVMAMFDETDKLLEDAHRLLAEQKARSSE